MSGEHDHGHIRTLLRTERTDAPENAADNPLRLQCVTCSEVAALPKINVHPYKTPARLYAEKTGLVVPDHAENAAKRRGRKLEAVVADEVRELRPGWKIEKAREFLRIADDEVRFGGTPDYYFEDEMGRRGILQIKTIAPFVWKKWMEIGGAPAWIVAQVSGEVLLDDAHRGVIGVLVNGDFVFETHVFEVERVVQRERRMIEACKHFWHDNVAAGVSPPMDYARDADLIASMNATYVKGKTIDLSRDNRAHEILDLWDHVTGDLNDAEKAKSALQAELREKIGDADTAIVGARRFTNREVVRHEAAREARETRYRQLRVFPARDE